MRHSPFQFITHCALIAVSTVSLSIAHEGQKEHEDHEAPKLSPEEIKTGSSYAAGYTTGMAFAEKYGQYGVNLEDFDMEIFIKGLKAASKGEEPEIDEEKLQAALVALGEIIEVREKNIAAENLKAGQEFLEKNAKREGVITTKSGLQYEVLVKGGEEKYVASTDGKPANKLFMVNYKGTKIDGTVIDESPKGEPVSMDLHVIEGFHETLTSMPVGAKWRIFIPSKLAYGERRNSADIGPNTTLIYEFELLEIKDVPKKSVFPHGLQLDE